MPGPGQRVKYPRGIRWKRFKKQKPTRGKKRIPSEAKQGGGQKGLTKGPWGGSKGGRVGKSSGGSIRTKLSSGGPVAKPN